MASRTRFFLLTYKYVPNVLEKRAPFRDEHLRHAQSFVKSGQLLLGGAFTDPVDSAAVVFKSDTKDEVERFVAGDPYVKNGIVTQHSIREWTVVIGSAL